MVMGCGGQSRSRREESSGAPFTLLLSQQDAKMLLKLISERKLKKELIEFVKIERVGARFTATVDDRITLVLRPVDEPPPPWRKVLAESVSKKKETKKFNGEFLQRVAKSLPGRSDDPGITYRLGGGFGAAPLRRARGRCARERPRHAHADVTAT